MNNLLGTIGAVTATIILVVMAVSLSEQATNSSTTQSALNEVQALVQNVRSLYSSSPGSYAGLSGCELQQMNLVPASMIVTGGGCGNLVDPWGGGVEVALSPSMCSSCWILEFTGVPSASCMALVAGVSNAATACIGGNCANAPGYPGGQSIPLSWIAQYCTAAGAGQDGGNLVSFYFLH